MALTCNVTLNVNTYSAGQNPPPQATVTVFNNSGATLVVTAIEMKARVLNGSSTNYLAMPPSVPPIGPGMSTSVSTFSAGLVSGVLNIGPFPIVIASAANANSFQAVNQSGNLFPLNPQGSQPPQFTVMVGATVYASDGSVNTAGEAALVVSYMTPPPLGYQGGFYQFASPNNFIGMTPGWP